MDEVIAEVEDEISKIIIRSIKMVKRKFKNIDKEWNQNSWSLKKATSTLTEE